MAILCVVIQLYTLVIVARAVLSWFPADGGALGTAHHVVNTLTEPVLGPLRRGCRSCASVASGSISPRSWRSWRCGSSPASSADEVSDPRRAPRRDGVGMAKAGRASD
ncbi:MAG: YggT family protein [Acidimicrobiales bacterium]